MFELFADALQLNSIKQKDFANYKRAFTVQAVKKIYEGMVKIWPDRTDCIETLRYQQNTVAALYTGSYEPNAVFEAISRHSLYADKILLKNPFPHPGIMREEYNPVIHPELYLAVTMKWTFLCMSLLPWFATDIVNLIYTPADYDPLESKEIIEIQREKFAANPQLEELCERVADELVRNSHALDGGTKEYMMLSCSDEFLLEDFYRKIQDPPWKTEKEFLQFIDHRRNLHPYYEKSVMQNTGQVLQESSGLCYEAAKRVCAITNAHIITNNALRWKEVELDHQYATGQTAIWSPFAKALQGSNIKVLNNVSLEFALRLREEQRLEQVRQMFNRVWRACREAVPYSDGNILNLSTEFSAKIDEAKYEWEKIDQDLIKWTGGTAAALFTAATGIGFVPAATAAVLTGTTGLTLAHWKRKSFKYRFPAGLFIDL